MGGLPASVDELAKARPRISIDRILYIAQALDTVAVDSPSSNLSPTSDSNGDPRHLANDEASPYDSSHRAARHSQEGGGTATYLPLQLRIRHIH